MNNQPLRIICLSPVYNDWESFTLLCDDLEKVVYPGLQLSMIAMNDSSTETHQLTLRKDLPVTVVNLINNLGHQKAIAVGLSYIRKNCENYDAVIVMDADGEDKPADLLKITDKLKETGFSQVIFASRKKRSEGLAFRISYFFYKKIFSMLTGKSISFGNFSGIPRAALTKAVALPELLNHFSGAILKSKMHFGTVSVDRGKRYMGDSKMSFQNLILHGFNAIAIYMDILSIRLLLLTFWGMLLSGLAIIAIVIIKLFTSFAIPGWASNISLLIINVIIQLFSITLLILLSQLNNRNHHKPTPAQIFEEFIESVEQPVQ